MAKRKSKSPIEGRWNIVSMTEWDEEFLHEEGQAFIEFGPKDTGEFQFGYVRGQMDCRVTEKDGKPTIEFSWDGFDEMDPESGYGWAAFESDSLTGVLAMEDVKLLPPTVNDLADLLAHAMSRPLTGGDRQRPGIIHLRDRPQWQELLPHLRQLGIEVVLSDDLPWFDEAVVEWMQQTKRKSLPSVDEIKTNLRKPFPERKRTLFTDAMDLMEWTDGMWKGAYPSRKVAVPLYAPTTVVPIQLTADELEAILTKTEIAKTKKLRPQLETMAAEGKTIELDINDWSRVLLALCGGRMKETAGQKHLLGIAKRIANHLAKALGIDPPTFWM